MVGHLTLHCLCPQVVERHHSLISFATRERSAPQISCKWAHSSLVEQCQMRPDAFWWSAVDAWILCIYVRLDLSRPEPRRRCFSSSLTGTKSLPLNPQFSSGMNLVVCVGFQMDGAGEWSFLLAHEVPEDVAPGSLNALLLDTFTTAFLSLCGWWMWSVRENLLLMHLMQCGTLWIKNKMYI